MRDSDFLAEIQKLESNVEAEVSRSRDEYIQQRIDEIRTKHIINTTESFLASKIGGTPLDIRGRLDELEAENEQNIESNPPWYAPFTEGIKVAFGVPGAKMPEYKPGMSRKEMLYTVAQEALNNPRYKDVIKTDEAGALGAQSYYMHVLQQVNQFETRMALVKGRMIELQHDGYNIDEAFDKAYSEIKLDPIEKYEAPTIANVALNLTQDKPISALAEVAADPWVWAPALVASPLSTAVALRGAGIASGWLANPFTRAGAVAVFSDMALSAAFMPLESQVQDILVEHPGWALAASFGMWGGAFGPMVDKFASRLIELSPGLPKDYARKYAERYISSQLRRGKVHKSVASTLDPILNDIMIKAEAMNKFDGATLKQITTSELKARGLEINASALEAATRIAKAAEKHVEELSTNVELKRQEWQAAEKAFEVAKKAQASQPLLSKLQTEAALSKTAWLNEQSTLQKAQHELARNKRDIDKLKSVVDVSATQVTDDVPILPTMVSDGSIDYDAVKAHITARLNISLDKEEETKLKTWLDAYTNAKKELGEEVSESELAVAIDEIVNRFH